ncbi:MAG: CapA family protein [Gorillibacterium sp.]|nr:CapA family protein [Gorillibacterium sp.]
MKRGSLFIFFLLLLLLFIGGIRSDWSLQPIRNLASTWFGPLPDKREVASPTIPPEDGPATTEKGPTSSPIFQSTETTVSLAAIGDVLIHGSIWKDAAVGDGFYFDPMFQKVKGMLMDADLTFANSESMVGGKDLGLSDYPRFNSPFEIADTLKNSGIDVVSMANNHTMDANQVGILEAIRHWDSLGVVYTGANKDEADKERLRVMEVDGVKIAFLAYTYGTNGIPVPADKPYLVNLLDEYKFVADIQQAKEKADVVAVSMHFGTEYTQEPTPEQQTWAQLAADAGADLIIGHHPHVLQPIKWLERKSGGRTLVFYSLGNFLAAQEQQYPWRQIGAIAKVDITKRVTIEGVSIDISNIRMLPTYIKYRNWRDFEVLPLDQVTNDVLPGADQFLVDTGKQLSRYETDVSILSSSSW